MLELNGARWFGRTQALGTSVRDGTRGPRSFDTDSSFALSMRASPWMGRQPKAATRV